MEIIGLILLAVGGIVAFVGGIWVLVLAFKQHILWGLGSLFVPFVSLVFVIKYHKVALKPFLICVAGWVLLIIGSVIAGAGAVEGMDVQGIPVEDNAPAEAPAE